MSKTKKNIIEFLIGFFLGLMAYASGWLTHEALSGSDVTRDIMSKILDTIKRFFKRLHDIIFSTSNLEDEYIMDSMVDDIRLTYQRKVNDSK